jgi:hypothetical protein
MSSAVARLRDLVEEKNLLFVEFKSCEDTETSGRDQVTLLCAHLDVLEYGRYATVWCQLALLLMSSSRSRRVTEDLSAASKLLLRTL